MSLVANSGDPKSPIWLIYEEPYLADAEKGSILSCGHGYTHKKVWGLSGLPDPYIYILKPCIGASYDESNRIQILLREIIANKVPFILPTTPNLFEHFCPDLVSKSQKKAILKKYSGNLLVSNYISHKHFIIPQYPADFVGANWDYHEIQAFIDYGHVKEEYEYWRAVGSIKPYESRNLVIEPNYDDLISYLYRIRFDFGLGNIQYVSTDIETIRPKAKSYYHKLHHPGYPYTITLAYDPYNGIAFSLWDYTSEQTFKIWKELAWILENIPQIGQNYFTFDSHFLEALGFKLCLSKCQDTMIRHHILWPGLEHKLQFQTKQYTRQPFYKDEGKQWSPKYKAQLLRYNALDGVITYEIFLAQEKEFAQRPYLK